MRKLTLAILLFLIFPPLFPQPAGFGFGHNLWQRLRKDAEAVVPLDSLKSFVVSAHDKDTAIVETAVGFDPDATNYQLRYLEGLSYPAITTGTQALSSSDSTAFQGLKVRINVPGDNTNYAFRLFSIGVDTVANSDTTQLDELIEYDPTNFYVDVTNGNDANSGTHPDTAWQTLSKVNGETFDPNDTIFLVTGETWRETLTVPSSGTSGNHIVFTSYGEGNNPLILGSEKATTFENITGNIWYALVDMTDPFTGTDGGVFFMKDGDVTWGDSVVYDAGKTNLVQEYDWCWQVAAGDDTLFVYAATDPDTRYDSVEVSQRDNGFALNSKEYITIDGIDGMFLSHTFVRETYPTADLTGCTVRNCTLSYYGTKDDAGYGTHFVYHNSLVEYNVISHMGRRGLSFVNYGTTDITNIVIQNNEFSDGYHTVGPDIETGTGAGDSGDIDSIIIRNNIISQDVTRNDGFYPPFMFFQGPQSGTGIIRGLYVYNNILENINWAGIQLEDVDSTKIYNNTIYGACNNLSGGNAYAIFATQGCTEIEIKNNILYSNQEVNYNLGLYETASQDHTEIDADYNLYYHEYSARDIILGNGTGYNMSEWDAMKSALGWETNSPTPADPDLNASWEPHADSAATDAGIAVPWINDDYNGVSRDDPPNIGAVETTHNMINWLAFILITLIFIPRKNRRRLTNK